ncbi:MAG: pyridoxamine 5'-phosphate oxidase family protein [Thermoplasmata archaeon]
MGELHSRLTPELQKFLEGQKIFFVATAPLSPQNHINVSPKGLDTLRVISLAEVAYLDLTGSGNETSAHLFENGRMTLMVCAFQGPPNVLRIYGKGTVHLPDSARWTELRPRFPDLPGARQIISLAIERVQTSCGYAVPFYELKEERQMLSKWATVKGPAGLLDYKIEKNSVSIDGLATHFGRRKK